MVQSNAIAVIANNEGKDLQALLSQAAAGWRETGARVVGVLAEDSYVEGVCSAAFLRDIATGRRFSIQLDAVPTGTTCHLDATGIADACAELLPQIASADVVLLSKFGKTEAAGQGLWDAFSTAVMAGEPMLTTITATHVEAWTTSMRDAAWLAGDIPSIEQWWRSARGQGTG